MKDCRYKYSTCVGTQYTDNIFTWLSFRAQSVVAQQVGKKSSRGSTTGLRILIWIRINFESWIRIRIVVVRMRNPVHNRLIGHPEEHLIF
jgi:hypothetical protein